MSADRWAGWMQLTPAEQEAARAAYAEQLRKERDANAARWKAMSPGAQAAYPGLPDEIALLRWADDGGAA